MSQVKVWSMELFGTFLLTSLGMGSVGLNEMFDGKLGLLGLAVVNSLGIMLIIYFTGKIAAVKINPAVTLGFWAGNLLSIKSAVFEVFFQLIGATLGALFIRTLFNEPTGLSLLDHNISLTQGVMIEAFLTFILVCTIYATNMKKYAVVSIGLIVFLSIFWLGDITGAVMNPARAFGPAIIYQDYSYLAVFFVGPSLGGLLAGMLSVSKINS